MSEKDASDSAYSLKNEKNSEAASPFPIEEEGASAILDSAVDSKSKNKDESVGLESSPPYESSVKKEENPFSFKKFLNQDSSSQKIKGAKKKIFTPAERSASESSESLNLGHNKNPRKLNSRINANDMSSVLPDFVQDHLVIEQCYLSGSSSDIDINNLNLQNLPDLNLEHRNVHFMLSDDRKENHLGEISSDKIFSNLPDFTLGANNIQPSQNTCNNERLPDFALHARTNDVDEIDLQSTRRNFEINNADNTSQTCRQRVQRVQISSSPSVPLDLPSCENNNSSHNFPIPFDLTAPVEDTSGTCRERSANETVSKSLPDFLSDGPIKKEMDDNLQNGLPSDIPLTRTEDRLRRQIDLLRSQLMEKNRRVGRLERELENIRTTDQRETASLEYALQEVENNLKQTAKRAQNAENIVLKLKQENKTLKSEVSSLRSENAMLRLNNYNPQEHPPEIIHQKVAKELKLAANQAENSLKSLLVGVKNLRTLADLIENKYQGASQDHRDFPNEESASGPSV